MGRKELSRRVVLKLLHIRIPCVWEGDGGLLKILMLSGMGVGELRHQYFLKTAQVIPMHSQGLRTIAPKHSFRRKESTAQESLTIPSEEQHSPWDFQTLILSCPGYTCLIPTQYRPKSQGQKGKCREVWYCPLLSQTKFGLLVRTSLTKASMNLCFVSLAGGFLPEVGPALCPAAPF